MAVSSDWGDPTVVPALIAGHIVTTANDYATAQKLPTITIDADFLTSAIVEITPETQIIGAALLQVQIADPASKIYRSGICDLTPDGLLPQVDVNFPEGSPVWWRLVMVDYQSVDSTQGSPNLTLTFQHRIVSYLSDCWGPLGWPAGNVGQTRAQFLKMLVTKMPGELPKQSIGPGAAPGDLSFICPEINELQPVSNASGTGVIAADGGNNTVLTSGSSKKLSDKINKQPALTAGTRLSVKGSSANGSQKEVATALLAGCQQAGASTLVMEACIISGIGESGMSLTDPLGFGGNGPQDAIGVYPATIAGATQMAVDYCKGKVTNGFGWAYGAIAYANGTAPPYDSAIGPYDGQPVTDPYKLAIFNQHLGTPYADQTGVTVAMLETEASAFVGAYNGGDLPQGSGTGSSTGGGNTGQSDIAQLTRGQSDNPDEDSWTCMQRLAQEVNWSLFTSPSPAPGTFGNYIYYADQPTIVQSKPALYLALSEDGTTWSATDPDTGKTIAADGVVNTLSVTVDNTSMTQEVTRTVKGKIRKKANKTVLRTPQTPTEIMFNMMSGLTGWLGYNAGDVFVFHDSGTANGRWIVEDVTCNILGDLFAQYTLGPPTYPYPEPQAVTTTTGGSKGKGANALTVSGASLDVSGYTNPLAKIGNLQPSRVDQGVDYNGSGPLLALGNGVITASSAPGWPGGGGVVLKLADGPYAGKYVYYFEDVAATVTSGKVTAGQQIATLNGSMEIGWCEDNSNTPIAQQYGQAGQQTGQSGDNGGVQTAAGLNFNALLVALNAPSGVRTPGVSGCGPLSSGPGMPSSWPTLTASDTKKAKTNNTPTGASGPGSFRLPSTSGPATGISQGGSAVVTKVNGGFSGLF